MTPQNDYQHTLKEMYVMQSRYWFLSIGFAIFLLSIIWGTHIATGRDDAHITIWSAVTLAEYGEILNYNGDRIEQSSTLLLTILIASIYKITGLNPVLITYWLSIFASAGCLIVVYALMRYICRDGAWIAPLLIVSTSPFAYWTFARMETTLVGLCALGLLWGILWFSSREQMNTWRIVTIASLILAFITVRPEMPIVLGCLLVGLLGITVLVDVFIANTETIQYKMPLRRLGYLVLLSGTLITGLFAFRYFYFGEFFPQPVLAKVSENTLSNVRNGLDYLVEHTLSGHMRVVTGAYILAGIYALWFSWRKRTFELIPMLLFCAVYTAYIIFSGGDWMENGRFLVPIIPVASLLVALKIGTLRLPSVVLFGMVIVAVGFLFTQTIYNQNSTGLTFSGMRQYQSEIEQLGIDKTRFNWVERMNRINVRDLELITVLDDLVADVLNQQSNVTILSQQQGIVTYYVMQSYFEQARIIDSHGLVDRTFIDCTAIQDRFQYSNFGLGLPIFEILVFRDLLVSECGMVTPDIVYVLATPINLIFNASDTDGYSLYYLNYSTLEDANNSVLKRQTVFGTQAIYVRTDLLPSDYIPVEQSIHMGIPPD